MTRLDPDRTITVPSPCCGLPQPLWAWQVRYAQAQSGRVLIQCGRAQTDPLEPVRPARGRCGRWYRADVTKLRPA